jgi:hypothetical protein
VCPEKVAGVSYIIPPKYHIESRGVLKKKKNDRVHFNYLHVGRDVLLSRIYRALETNAKVYKLSGCVEPFSLNYYVHCTW